MRMRNQNLKCPSSLIMPHIDDNSVNKSDQMKINEKLKDFSISADESEKKISYLSNLGTHEINSSVCLIVIGMAGSGKTTFIQRLVSELHSRKTAPYVVNLDPAVYKVPYPVNIDIRESIRFKQVMQNYKLGPNGAIVTCLNFFATKFNQINEIIESRITQHNHIIFDTPGQIEVFTWSASGPIITKSLASIAPTVMVYVIDAEKSMNPITFMSNMLHACSVRYRSHIPLVIVLNKIDIADYQKIVGWMRDFELFEQAIDSYGNNENSPYAINLVHSLSLVLDEFYHQLNFTGVSSITGEGFSEFIDVIVPNAIDEFMATQPPASPQNNSHSKSDLTSNLSIINP